MDERFKPEKETEQGQTMEAVERIMLKLKHRVNNGAIYKHEPEGMNNNLP